MHDLTPRNVLERSSPGPAASTPTTRRLVPVKRLSYGLPGTDNHVVHGENLAAMACLGPAIGGRVKCAYMDPPYRSGERFTHYADDAGHDEWLRDVSARVQKVWELL